MIRSGRVAAAAARASTPSPASIKRWPVWRSNTNRYSRLICWSSTIKIVAIVNFDLTDWGIETLPTGLAGR